MFATLPSKLKLRSCSDSFVFTLIEARTGSLMTTDLTEVDSTDIMETVCGVIGVDAASNEEDKVDTCGVIGVDADAASDEEDKVNTCGVVDVDVDAASDEDRVDTCGVIDVDPATGNDKADTDTCSVGSRMGEVTAVSEELDWPSCAD